LDLQRDRESAETATATEIAALDSNARVQISEARAAATAQISEARAEAAAQVSLSRNDALHWKNLTEGMYASTSWRLTAPIRRLSEILRSSTARLAKLIQRGKRLLRGRTAAAVRMAQLGREPEVENEPSTTSMIPPDKDLEIANLNLSVREQTIYLDLTRAIHHNLQ
jgi:hypothetical protein